MDPARLILRHTIAALAYRASRALHDAPPRFAEFGASTGSRTPAQILAHMGDLFDWALSIARGQQKWRDSDPLPWPEEEARFFAALTVFDEFLASPAPLAAPAERLFQGPIADALTHVGQISMLRRMAGNAVRGENFFVADVEVGRTGREQSAPRRQFD